MKLSYILSGFLFLLLIAGAFASQINSGQTNVYYFWQVGCTHCTNVEASGILEKVGNLSGVNLQKLEIRSNSTNAQMFTNFANQFGIPQNQRGTPLAVVEKNGNYSYLIGDGPIINNLENATLNFQEIKPVKPTILNVTWGAVILAALVDSLNPCAIGVLAFLMISLLKLGSSKRALKAGIIYSFVVFLVYFLSGFGIFKIIQNFTSATHYIYLGVGILVLVLGFLQFIDFLAPGKFISLRIPTKAKPLIERIASKGTLPAIVALGAIVALFELPCTGGIYLGILTLISQKVNGGIWYLIVYNLLFILPLLVMTYIIYKGTSPQLVENWGQKEKGWMKLASAIVMIALGIYILVI